MMVVRVKMKLGGQMNHGPFSKSFAFLEYFFPVDTPYLNIYI